MLKLVSWLKMLENAVVVERRRQSNCGNRNSNAKKQFRPLLGMTLLSDVDLRSASLSQVFYSPYKCQSRCHILLQVWDVRSKRIAFLISFCNSMIMNVFVEMGV